MLFFIRLAVDKITSILILWALSSPIKLCLIKPIYMTIPVTLRDAHAKFINHLKERKRASATILAYGKDIEQLISFLEELQKAGVHEITKEDIEAFLAKFSSQGYTKKSISRKINSTKTFYRFLKVQEIITDDPAALVQHPKYELKPPRILSPLEYRALRDAARADERTSAIIEILLQTGIRIAELANLRLSDIKEGTLHIRPVEGHEARIVPLNKAAKSALDRYLRSRPKGSQKETDHIFITKNAKPLLIRNIRTTIDRFFQLAGIEGAKVNDLRHTFIAHHIKRGASLMLLSKVVGHKRISTTERYLEWVKDRAEEKGSVLTEL